jgi:hypothetical protein
MRTGGNMPQKLRESAAADSGKEHDHDHCVRQLCTTHQTTLAQNTYDKSGPPYCQSAGKGRGTMITPRPRRTRPRMLRGNIVALSG